MLSELLERIAAARRANRLDEALQFAAQAVGQATGADRGRALAARGQIERDSGQTAASLQSYEQAAASFREHGDLPRLAHSVRHAADVASEMGDRGTAEVYYREALALYAALPEKNPLDVANALRGWALLLGHAPEARTAWQQARDLYTTAKVEAGVAECTRRIEQLSGL